MECGTEANMPSTGSREADVAVGSDGAARSRTRFVVVVPPERPDVYAQLAEAMAGENVCVVVDRRHGDRRNHWSEPRVDRRRTYRRGTTSLNMTPACPGS
jgi:hypothetical protein